MRNSNYNLKFQKSPSAWSKESNHYGTAKVSLFFGETTIETANYKGNACTKNIPILVGLEADLYDAHYYCLTGYFSRLSGF